MLGSGRECYNPVRDYFFPLRFFFFFGYDIVDLGIFCCVVFELEGSRSRKMLSDQFLSGYLDQSKNLWGANYNNFTPKLQNISILIYYLKFSKHWGGGGGAYKITSFYRLIKIKIIVNFHHYNTQGFTVVAVKLLKNYFQHFNHQNLCYIKGVKANKIQQHATVYQQQTTIARCYYFLIHLFSWEREREINVLGCLYYLMGFV